VVANTPAATKATSGLASLVVAVEATGGAMDFAERPGGGTLVTVTIPDELNQG
jgi:sensor histidine kinase regulating citrate/malate metabolism